MAEGKGRLSPALSIILPANNEAGQIGGCLAALFASEPPGLGRDRVEIIVVANACQDDTADIARSFSDQAASRGWALVVLETETGGKLNALNTGDEAARSGSRAYLDADVVLAPDLLAELLTVLAVDAPVYASGRVRIARAKSAVSRAYGRFYARVPFMTDTVPGCGLFAVNAAARARWRQFPDIISDDTYGRLLFRPHERVLLKAAYDWPLVEGFANLVKVRRRQDLGVAEIAARYPNLLANEDKPRFGVARLLRSVLAEPVGFVVYATVALAVRLGFGRATGWARGR